jgi:hypothetical protein
MLLSILSAVFLLWFAAAAVSGQGTSSQSSQTQPAKSPAPKAPPAAKAETPAAPRAPQTSAPLEQLEFSSKSLSLVEGDHWAYLVSSTDAAVDGKILNVTLQGKDPERATFAVQLGEAAAAIVNLSAAQATWFTPQEGEKGGFGLVGIGDDYPQKVERGVQWNKTMRFFSYDDYGRRSETGYVISASAPDQCVVACGTFPCTELRRTDLSGPIERQIWLSPNLPAALRAKLRRPGGQKGWVLFELVSVEASGQSRKAAGGVLPAAERQKAIDWIKANNKFGADSDLVMDLVHLLQEGVLKHPGAGLKFLLGRELTKDAKGYVLEWRAGKFSARQMTVEENQTAGPMSFTRQVVR